MNLSNHSISSHSARYSAEPAAGAADSAASADANAEFDALFADVAQRCDSEKAKTGVSRTETRGNSRRTEAASSRPRARVEEKEKVSEQKPNENLVSHVEEPLSQPADEVELEGDEVPKEPVVAVMGEENDNAINDGAGNEDVAPALLDAGEIEDLGTARPPQKEGIPAADADVEEITFADTQDLGGVNLASDVSQEEAAKKVIPPEPLNRGSGKSLGDSKDKVAADFAEFESDAPGTKAEAQGSESKNFLSGAVTEVTTRVESLGINVAEVAAHMNQAASPHELAGLLSKQVAAHDGVAPSSFEAQNPLAAQAAALSGLHQAVNAAMEAGERMKSGGQRAVDLQFSFGSDDLSVRVELHEGRVRATFRTDSAEIRGALAQEWQVLNTAGVERAKRFADPVFVSNSSASSAGDHHEKRGGRNQDMHAPVERFEISNSRGVSAPASARVAASGVSPQTAAPLTALRLHTFA